MLQANSKTTDKQQPTSVRCSPVSNPFCFAQELFRIFRHPNHPNISTHPFPPPISEMAPHSVAIAYQETPSTAAAESAAWCIPFLAFYAFGVLASMTILWAVAKFSSTPPWPPARFHNDKRSGPLYQLVLYFPALLWLALLAVGILCLLGCGLLHLWRWIIRKLSPASSVGPGPCDEISLSRQTDGVCAVLLKPAGEGSTDISKGGIVQIEQETKNIALGESVTESTLGNQKEAVQLHQLSAADKNTGTRQEPGEVKEHSQKSKNLDSRCA